MMEAKMIKQIKTQLIMMMMKKKQNVRMIQHGGSTVQITNVHFLPKDQNIANNKANGKDLIKKLQMKYVAHVVVEQ